MPFSRNDSSSFVDESYSEGFSEVSTSINGSAFGLAYHTRKKSYHSLALDENSQRNSFLSLFASESLVDDDDRTFEYDDNSIIRSRFGTPISTSNPRMYSSLKVEPYRYNGGRPQNKLVEVFSNQHKRKKVHKGKLKVQRQRTTSESSDSNSNKGSTANFLGTQPVYLTFHSQVGRKEFAHHKALRTVTNDLEYSWDKVKDSQHYHIPNLKMGRTKTKKVSLENSHPWANVGIGERSHDVAEAFQKKKIFATDYQKMAGRDFKASKNTLEVLEVQSRLGPGSYDPKEVKIDKVCINLEKTVGRDAKVQHITTTDTNVDSRQYDKDSGFSYLSTTKDYLPNITFGEERYSKFAMETGLPPCNDLVYETAQKPEAHVPGIELRKFQAHKEDEPMSNYLYTASKVIDNLQNNIKRVKRLKKKTPFVKKVVQKMQWMDDIYFDSGVKAAPLRLVQ